jgi:dihydroxyacetone kinase-like protein
MGPIYGTFFLKMGEAAKSSMNIDKGLFFRMLVQARKGLQEIGNAQVGDKTLIDTLVAAENALQKSIEKGDDSVKALHAMVEGARSGMESTKEMVAKLGRAARLGERSRGTLDPGATSCFILLEAMALKTTELFKQ